MRRSARFGRPAIGEADDDEPVFHFGGVEAEPRPRRRVAPAEFHQIVEDRLEQIDRHDHVEILRLPLLDRLLQLQRADADEIAGRPDQRRAAPVRMRRRGEDRLVEHVFPVAGEFLLGDDARGDRALPPAGAADHDALADRRGARLADLERRHVELGQRLHQTEAGLLVVAEHMAGHRAAVVEREPDRLGLGDQIADGQNEAVAANEDAVAGALGAERLRREGVGRNDRAHADHAGQRALEIVAIVLRLGLHRGRHLPVAHGCHLHIPSLSLSLARQDCLISSPGIAHGQQPSCRHAPPECGMTSYKMSPSIGFDAGPIARRFVSRANSRRGPWPCAVT